MVPAIETVGLTKYYGSVRGIEDVDLVVEPGQVFGFLGPNGAGKTTCMRVLLDLLVPTRGVARVLGLDSRADSLEIRRRVGYLAGDVSLYPRLKVRAHLHWLGELRGGVPDRRIDELADALGLDLDRAVGDLSTGNRQKVGLVQALMHDPELLILDEPTSGLDPLVQHTFQALVREVAAAGRTVFLSSHVLDEVDRTCDRVAILREGRLLAVERVEQLRARSIRHVSISFDDPVVVADFAALPGVRSARGDGRQVELDTTGTLDAVVKLAAQHRVVDFVSEQADLESVFLAFYGGDESVEGA